MKRLKVSRLKVSRRGIYLISTLLLLTFLVIVGGAIMVSFQQGIASSGSFNNRQMATQAAMAGLQYTQALLETNASSFTPADSPTTKTLQTQDGGFRVIHRNFNICGYLTNGQSSGSSEGRYILLFRVCFNKQWATYDADADADSWSFLEAAYGIDHKNIPPIPYVSMNNVTRSVGSTGNSYDSAGNVFQTVPGGYADIIVEGLAIGPSGNVIARRNVECMMALSQVGTLAGAASSAGNLGLTVNKSGGTVQVSAADSNASYASQAGLASLQNINIYGADAVSGGTMTDYSSTASASLTSLSSKHFNYISGGVTTDFTASAAQAKTVTPPAINQTQLPNLRSGQLTVTAGTWVVWNDKLYHYATDYAATDSSGNPIAVNSQQWGQSSSNTPPTYKGVTTDTPNGLFSLDSAGQLTLDKTQNQITLTDQDLEVTPSGSVNSFALVVAPNGTTSSGATITNTSAAVGSPQLIMAPSEGQQPPQFRSRGSITVMGNVVGQGSLVTTGLDVNSNTIAADINVVGKSSLDSRSDAGVAIYSAGNMNLLQLSTTQTPASVPAVGSAMSAQGVTPGSGDKGNASTTTTAYQFDDKSQAVYSALTQAMAGYLAKQKESYSSGKENGLYKASSGGIVMVTDQPNIFETVGTGVASQIDKVNVSLTYQGQKLSGPLNKVLSKLIPSDGLLSSSKESYNDIAIAKLLVAQAGGGHTYDNITPLSQAGEFGTPSASPHRGSQAISLGAGYYSNYQQFGVATTDNSQSTTQTTTTINADNTTTTTTTTDATALTLDQTFSGLIYSQKNINMVNQLGQITVDGAIAAYGADPRTQQAGQGGTGSVNISGDNVKLQYDPTVLGPFASFFGGQVKFSRACLTVF